MKRREDEWVGIRCLIYLQDLKQEQTILSSSACLLPHRVYLRLFPISPVKRIPTASLPSWLMISYHHKRAFSPGISDEGRSRTPHGDIFMSMFSKDEKEEKAYYDFGVNLFLKEKAPGNMLFSTWNRPFCLRSWYVKAKGHWDAVCS